MVVYSVYVISKSGGLIYNYDHNSSSPEIEKSFSFPLDLKLDYIDQRLVVTFGQRDGIKVGYSVLAINGEPLIGRKIRDKDVLNEFLSDETNFPVNIRLGIPKLSANEKIVLASVFHSMYAIAAIQLSGSKVKEGSKVTMASHKPPASSGIELLETENFRLNCFQTLTGVKFVLISDLIGQSGSRETILKKIYEIYSDYALKNPFYSLDMPIRCELFDHHLISLLDQADKSLTAM